MRINNIKSCFLGLAIGDALGVPVEFRNRAYLKEKPITDLTGYGAWNQPLGTWSDDSSMTFCLAESLTKGYSLDDVANTFTLWMNKGYWGCHHKVFDIGNTTRSALQRVAKGENPKFSGEFDESSNGNGSLMRTIPASLYFMHCNDQLLFENLRDISSITHAHFRSVFSCFIYSKIAIAIFNGLDKEKAYLTAIKEVRLFLEHQNFNPKEISLFNRVLSGKLADVSEEDIESLGYVLHTLEASIWCLLNTDSYPEAVLRAVNLGGDTDTTACVTGALAGLYYGEEGIPKDWISKLVRSQDITILSENFKQSLLTMILAKS